MASFEKRKEEEKREEEAGKDMGVGTDFKLKQVLLFWKMNGGCYSVFGRRRDMEKRLF